MNISNRFCHFAGWSGRKPPPRASETDAREHPDSSVGAAHRADRHGSIPPWTARPARADDFEAWDELFAGYCDFYRRPSTPAHRRLVWSWVEAGTIHCLLAVPAADGRPVGLAHVRPMPSPLRGTTTGFLDDLFVAPGARGSGAFECLMAAVRDLAGAEGWPQVRWITAADNARAQAAYDRVATKTDWVTYQLDP